jgi:GNAT superfamily N-acetyltransferase
VTEKDGADPQSLKIEPLSKKHDRVVFCCGDDALDTYLKKKASQEAKKKIATTFVMADNQTREVIGYYTLSATSILLADLPDETARKLPKYPQVPATLLGRMAIDSRHQGRGYGELLIIDALRRALQATQRRSPQMPLLLMRSMNALGLFTSIMNFALLLTRSYACSCR